MSAARDKGCRRAVLLFFAATLALVACSGVPATITPSPTALGFLTPYWSPTPTGMVISPKVSHATPVPPPVPTLTPYLYKVVKGDTMLGIALRYGLTLEELQAANPDVDPRFLSIGVDLVIPLNQGTPQVMPTPTPVPLQVSEPSCYPAGDGGLWCYLLARNSAAEDLENLSARIVLSGEEPGESLEGIAIPALNLLPSGKSIPLGIYYPAPIPQDYDVSAALLSALPVESSGRYLPIIIQVGNVELHANGSSATVTGEVSLPKRSTAARVVWIAGSAYREDGTVVGVRKLEFGAITPQGTGQPGSTPIVQTPSPTSAPESSVTTAQAPGLVVLNAGESMPFELTIYSLGPAIVQVEVLAEARP